MNIGRRVFRIGNEGVSVLSWGLRPEDVGGFAGLPGASWWPAETKFSDYLPARVSLSAEYDRIFFNWSSSWAGGRSVPQSPATLKPWHVALVRCRRFVHEQCHNPVFIGHITGGAS
jgi:hypothetical protein